MASTPCAAAAHDACDPDDCFKAKMAYWRERGAPGVHYEGGQKLFHDSTIRTEQARIVAQAAAKGNVAVPYRSVYGS